MKGSKITEGNLLPILDCPLFNSFTFAKGIGLKTETTLKELGINSWIDVKKKECPDLFSKKKWHTLWNSVNSAIEALRILMFPA